MKNLKSLIGALPSAKYKNLEDRQITGVVSDSREVKKGSLFVAIKGQQYDGHDFILEAIEKGAAAVVAEIPDYIQIEDSRKALGLLTSAWYDFPTRKLKVIGVTGTDGKTTTVNLIYSILEAAGKRVGMVSTVSAKIGEKFYETGLHTTTPEPRELWKFLHLMVEKGCEHAVLEVTSHALDQERVAGIDFEISVLTNISPEHLDYHKNFKDYLATKLKLLEKAKLAVVNKDDPSYDQIKFLPLKVVTYGIKSDADFKAESIRVASRGTSFRVGERVFETALLGKYNVYNILAAIAATRSLGIDWGSIKKGIENLRALPGRFEKIENDHGLNIVIDFAHTPNALEKVLKLCSKLKASGSRLIVVFGCAGERDRQKRPKMGEIAGRLADFVVLTVEDPRTENVDDIIEEIARGCGEANGVEDRTFFKISDRQEAINFAIQKLARAGDWVLLCGKGHEKSMCFGEKEYSWSECGAVMKALR